MSRRWIIPSGSYISRIYRLCSRLDPARPSSRSSAPMLLDQETAFWRWVQHLCGKVNSRFRCSRGGEYLNHRAVTGSPTYMHARARVFASAVGSQIEFVQADPVSYLVSPVVRAAKFDFVVLCHCIWYFSRPDMCPTSLDVNVRVASHRSTSSVDTCSLG